MSICKLKQIDDLISPENKAFENGTTRFGELWSSQHHLNTDTTYNTKVPEGLHIGSGFANLQFQSLSLGQIQTCGASLQILQCPAGFDENVTTRIGKGRVFSGGLHFSDIATLQSEELQDILAKLATDAPLNISTNIPFDIAKRLCSSADQWFQGKALELYMEAKAYEYMAVATAVLSNNDFILAKNVTRYAKQARDIIEADLENVPTLAVLASIAATNVRSLTQAFRNSYGCTIQEYVTERRMEKAIMLLEQGHSVSETAYRIGYSLPYFSERFNTHYGFNASTVSRHLNNQ
jgi:AraC-like DNA-binding protein